MAKSFFSFSVGIAVLVPPEEELSLHLAKDSGYRRTIVTSPYFCHIHPADLLLKIRQQIYNILINDCYYDNFFNFYCYPCHDLALASVVMEPAVSHSFYVLQEGCSFCQTSSLKQIIQQQYNSQLRMRDLKINSPFIG